MTLVSAGGPSARWQRAAGVAFVASLALGAWLRWRMWGGPTSDEVSVVMPLSRWGLDAFFDNPEWGRNSPLLPFLFSFIDRPATLMLAGRALVVTCSLAAAVPVFFAARRVTRGDSVAGAIAGAFVALNPMLACEGVTFRAYGLFAFIEACRLLCLCDLVEAPTSVREPPVPGARPGTGIAFAALTALLPWTHYAAFPLLALEAVAMALLVPGWRRLLLAYGVAAFTSLPLVSLILESHVWIAPSSSPFDRAVFAWSGSVGWPPALCAGVLTAMLALAMWSRRPGPRAVAAHALALAAAIGFLAAREQLRPSAAALGVASMGLVLGVLAGGFPRGAVVLRPLVALVVFGTLPSQFRPEGTPVSLPVFDSNHIVAFAAERLRDPQPVAWHVFPSWDAHVLRFDLEAAGAAPSRDESGAFHVGAASYVGVADLDAPPGRLVVFSCDHEPKATGCRPSGGPRCARTYDCD